jgi:hypothetical protein
MTIRNVLSALAVFAGIMVGATAASAQGMHFFAVLNGGNEISPAGQANAGDPNGFGTAHVMFAGPGRLCYGISVFGISAPIAAHIHEAEAGTNGPIVVTLAPPVLTAGAGTASGCVSGIAAALLASIRNTPGNFYVNVHTGQFPAGAVRGQLF